MLRKLLLLLALLVLVAIGLVYLGVINYPGGTSVEVRPVEVQLEPRQFNVQVPTVATVGGEPNAAQPAAPAAPPPAANGAAPAPPQ